MLTALLGKYLQNLAVKGFADSTLRVRRVHMEMFLAWCKKSGIVHPLQVTKTTLDGYQGFLFDYRKKNGQPLAMASQHSRLAPLKVWFRWMVRRNYISHDPATELELPRVGYKLPRVLNKDEAELVLRQPRVEKPLGLRDRALLEVLYSSGLRRMEILKLKLYDLDKNHGLVAVREGKGKRDRIVPIGERALAWLERYLVEVRPLIVGETDEGYVFLSSTGRQFAPNYLSWLVRRYLRAPMALYGMAKILSEQGEVEQARQYASRCYQVSVRGATEIDRARVELLGKHWPEFGVWPGVKSS